MSRTIEPPTRDETLAAIRASLRQWGWSRVFETVRERVEPDRG